MKYELRNIDLQNNFEVSNAIQALREFVNDPNKRGLKDLFKFPGGEFYQIWMLKDKFVVDFHYDIWRESLRNKD